MTHSKSNSFILGSKKFILDDELIDIFTDFVSNMAWVERFYIRKRTGFSKFIRGATLIFFTSLSDLVQLSFCLLEQEQVFNIKSYLFKPYFDDGYVTEGIEVLVERCESFCESLDMLSKKRSRLARRFGMLLPLSNLVLTSIEKLSIAVKDITDDFVLSSCHYKEMGLYRKKL